MGLFRIDFYGSTDGVIGKADDGPIQVPKITICIFLYEKISMFITTIAGVCFVSMKECLGLDLIYILNVVIIRLNEKIIVLPVGKWMCSNDKSIDPNGF